MSSISTTELNQAVGERLATVRAATGLSQPAFAAGLGLSFRAYCNYERGEREMPVAVLRALYEVHDVDPVWLLSGPETDPVIAQERRLNLPLLEELIRVIEEHLHQARKTLKPGKKARLIRLAYQRCMLAGQVDAAEVRDMLSLAA